MCGEREELHRLVDARPDDQVSAALDDVGRHLVAADEQARA
jgi:hypothetical protein